MAERKKALRRALKAPEIVSVPWLTVVRPGRAKRYVVLHDQVEGFYTHWDPKVKRTIECVEPKPLCAGCAAKLPYCSKGVISVQAYMAVQAELLDIPPECWVALEVIGKKGSLRGKVIDFQRETANIRSRLLATFVEEFEHPERLLAALDPLPTLRKIWGMA